MQLVHGSIALLCVCVLTFNSVDARSVRAYADDDDSSSSSEMERRNLHKALADTLLTRSSKSFQNGGARKRQGGSDSGDFNSGFDDFVNGSGDFNNGFDGFVNGSGGFNSGYGDLDSKLKELFSILGGLDNGSGNLKGEVTDLLNNLATCLNGLSGSHGGSDSGSTKRRHFNAVPIKKNPKPNSSKRNHDGGYNGDLDD